MTQVRMRGALAYHSGLAAEEQVAARYTAQGAKVCDRRWRGRYGGEIDIIAQDGDAIVFIEVKQAKDHFGAAERLSERQVHRICVSAQEYVETQSLGNDITMRFDVALVDRGGQILTLHNVLTPFF